MTWQDNATCNDDRFDPDIWFPDAEDKNAVARAVQICEGCPVREPCAEWGIRHENYGIWGGLTGPQLDEVRRHMNVRRVALDVTREMTLRTVA